MKGFKGLIADSEDIHLPETRKRFGRLTGMVGIFCNVILFLTKLLAGLFTNSIAIISDAFNNLSDSGSSIIALFGSNLSNKPPDREHPYGHGRFEYVTSLIVAFLIFAVGFELADSSIRKIWNPEPVDRSLLSVAILLISILVKMGMYFFNIYIAKLIGSSINLALAKDSMNDVLATGAVLLGLLVSTRVDWPVDGILGFLISLLIMYTGFSTARDAVNLLLGASPDPKVFEQIKKIVNESDFVRNPHDFALHDYGPGKKLGSMHVVVPPDVSVEKAHTEIHNLEKTIKERVGIDIVIHADPHDAVDEEEQTEGEQEREKRNL